MIVIDPMGGGCVSATRKARQNIARQISLNT